MLINLLPVEPILLFCVVLVLSRAIDFLEHIISLVYGDMIYEICAQSN